VDLKKYFEDNKGTGILGTADADGNINLAVYARPHMIDDTTAAFIMSDRLSHRNLGSNGKAAYLFIEESPGYRGIRLYLTKVKETSDPEEIKSMRRRKTYGDEDGEKARFLVYFSIDKTIPLLGGTDEMREEP